MTSQPPASGAASQSVSQPGCSQVFLTVDDVGLDGRTGTFGHAAELTHARPVVIRPRAAVTPFLIRNTATIVGAKGFSHF